MNTTDPRLGSIGSLLGGAKPRPRLQVPDAPVVDARNSLSADMPTPAKPRTRAKATQDSVVRIPVRTPAPVAERLSQARRLGRASVTEVLYDVLEAAAKDIDGFQRAIERVQRVDAPTTGDLFARTVKSVVEPKITVEFRMPSLNAEMLDRLMEQFGAKSRTTLILTALETYLPAG